MYGIEANTGAGGLAAQLPYPDRFLSQAAAINGGASLIAGAGYGGVAGSPYDAPINNRVALPAQQAPQYAQKQGWQQILDWHNNPAAWILGLILLLYGWLHLSVRARAGSARAGLSV
jgi:hypothetical protein